MQCFLMDVSNSEEKSTWKYIEHMSTMHETLIAVLNAAKWKKNMTTKEK